MKYFEFMSNLELAANFQFPDGCDGINKICNLSKFNRYCFCPLYYVIYVLVGMTPCISE